MMSPKKSAKRSLRLSRRKRPAAVTTPKHKFGQAIAFGKLYELAGELKELRLAPPEVTKKKGSRLGEILGFIRGLHLSARLIYFLRDQLSHTNCDVNWGHLLDGNDASCSPECDIIIHDKGYLGRWNGGDRPVMDFRFIRVTSAKAVVSCKSLLTSIDQKYPATLRKFGVKKVFLFAECCKKRHLARLRKTARAAGYAGVYCLYLIETGKSDFQRNEREYEAFTNAVLKAAS